MKKVNKWVALCIGLVVLAGCGGDPGPPTPNAPARSEEQNPSLASSATSPTAASATPTDAPMSATALVTYSVQIPDADVNGINPTQEFVAVDAQDNAYTADRSGHILKISPDGIVINRWDVVSSRGPGPEGLAVDSTGNIYVSDGGLGHITKVSPNGELLTTWQVPGDSEPRHSHLLATDRQGNVYMVHNRSERVLKYSPTGKLLADWRLAYAADGQVQQAQLGQLGGPTGVAVAGDGSVYVASHGNPEHTNILKYSPAGKQLMKVGTSGSEPGNFMNPERVAVDEQGNVYVTDGDNYRVQKLSPEGKPLVIWQTRPFYPAGIAVDRKGNVYLGGWNKDTDGRSALIKFAPDGKVLAVWR